MVTLDETPGAELGGGRRSRGISHVGGDLRISDLILSIDDEGQVSMGAPRVETRTDMWPYWLEEAIEGAAVAAGIGSRIPGTLAELESGGDGAGTADERLRALTIRELRASMRSITASAFAIDAFYASVKARAPEHPHQSVWREKGTARHKQVAETFRFHLHITKRESVKSVKSIIEQLFRFRNWAVHPGSKYRELVYRPDLNAACDWHFNTFRQANALAAVHEAVMLLDALIDVLDRGGEELSRYKDFAKRTIAPILDLYESHNAFLPIARQEPPTQTG